MSMANLRKRIRKTTLVAKYEQFKYDGTVVLETTKALEPSTTYPRLLEIREYQKSKKELRARTNKMYRKILSKDELEIVKSSFNMRIMGIVVRNEIKTKLI